MIERNSTFYKRCTSLGLDPRTVNMQALELTYSKNEDKKKLYKLIKYTLEQIKLSQENQNDWT